MKELLKKEPVRRAIRTFVQAAAGCIAGNITVAIMDVEHEKAIIAVIATAVATGIAAVMNIERKEL